MHFKFLLPLWRMINIKNPTRILCVTQVSHMETGIGKGRGWVRVYEVSLAVEK